MQFGHPVPVSRAQGNLTVNVVTRLRGSAIRSVRSQY